MHTGPWRLNARPLVTVFAPALAAFGLYALVLVEARYLAPFVVLLILGSFMLVRLPDARWSAVLIARVSVVVVSTLLLQIGWSTSGLSARSSPRHARAAFWNRTTRRWWLRIAVRRRRSW